MNGTEKNSPTQHKHSLWRCWFSSLVAYLVEDEVKHPECSPPYLQKGNVGKFSGAFMFLTLKHFMFVFI